MTNALYYGDNLDILRRYIDDDSVDLVYLDPPFQSGRDYNVLFDELDGTQAAGKSKHSRTLGHGMRDRPRVTIPLSVKAVQ